MQKVSIIIPCYNLAHYVDRAIESCLSQSYENIEIIAVNDGSTDSSLEVIQQYSNHTNLQIIDQPNKGLGAARNAGILKSTGAYLQFLDADDIIYPNKIQDQAAILEANPDIPLALCDFDTIDSGNEIINSSIIGDDTFIDPQDLLPTLIQNGFFPPHIPLVNKKFIKNTEYFDERRDYAGTADYKFWCSIAAKNGRYHYTNRVMAAYRFLENSMSKDVPAMDAGLEGVHLELMKSHPDRMLKAITRIRRSHNALHQANTWLSKQLNDRLYLSNYPQIDSENLIKSAHFIHSARNNQLYIWGTGEAGRKAYLDMQSNGIEVDKFIDNDVKKSKNTLEDLEIVHSEDFLNCDKMNNDAFVLIASMHFADIKDQILAKQSIPQSRIGIYIN